ncbi:hypothetical protein Tco_1289017, partial [Tanacetum coccineum]
MFMKVARKWKRLLHVVICMVKTVNIVDTDDENEGFASAENVENEKLGEKILDKVVESDKLESKILEDKVVENEKVGENLSESKGDKVVVENGVKVTNEGDSVVEDIKVDVAMVDPGVAVVIKNPDELSLADPVAMSDVRDEITPSILLVVDFGGWYKVDLKASNGRASATRDGWEKPDGGMFTQFSCSLRSSYERQYLLTNKEDEARTIDIMRILITYGFDPVN